MDHQALRQGRKGDHARIKIYGQQVLVLWRRMNDEFMMLAKAFGGYGTGRTRRNKHDIRSRGLTFSCNAYASIYA